MSEEKKQSLKTLFIVNVTVGTLLAALMWRHDLVEYIIQMSRVPTISWDLGWVGVSFALMNMFAMFIMVTESKTLARQFAIGGTASGALTFCIRVGILINSAHENNLGDKTFGMTLILTSCYMLLITAIVKKGGYKAFNPG